MTNEPEKWPVYLEVEKQPLLHAIGVFAVVYAQFERSIEEHYMQQANRNSLPFEMARLYFYSLDQQKRLQQIINIFEMYEKDKNVIDCVIGLIRYFEWARDCRDQILHSELHSSLFSDPERIVLTKKKSKNSGEQIYSTFTLQEIRKIVDDVQMGLVLSSSIHIHLRYKNQDQSKIDVEIQDLVKVLPRRIPVPAKIRQASMPFELLIKTPASAGG